MHILNYPEFILNLVEPCLPALLVSNRQTLHEVTLINSKKVNQMQLCFVLYGFEAALFQKVFFSSKKKICYFIFFSQSSRIRIIFVLYI